MPPLTPVTLLDQSRNNLSRVRGLVDLYERVAGSTQGRPSVGESDILRSAAVFLHATLEDFLRGVAELRLPSASGGALGKIPFVGAKAKESSFLEILANYRGRTVDDVIGASIASHLDRKTYNSVDEVASLLADVGLSLSTLLRPYAGKVAALMTRRHHIAHRFDKNVFTGAGQHPARSLSRGLIVEWIEAVSNFIEETAKAL